MSWISCENFNPGLPDTKVLLYNNVSLDPTTLRNHGLFRSVVRTSNHVLVTDTNVAKLYVDDLQACLKALDIHAQVYVLQPGDASKSIADYSALLEQCAGFKLDKASTVIAFGGGVVGDVAGFLASTLFRGVNFVNIPTTVLNQVDAAIDWKKGLNLPWGKNMIGCMYSPAEVWVNAAFLRTLDERQTRDGISECIKMALCLSTSYLDNLLEARIHDEEWLAVIINESAAFKTELMKRDNQHVEGVKQYGHAVGHAVEHLSKRRSGYGHGEAIAIGMCITAEMALITGHCDQETVDAHYEAFRKHQLPTTVPDWLTSEEIWAQTTTDKHFLNGEMYTMIVTRIGTTAEDTKGRAMLPFGKDIVIQALQNNRKKAV
jgi:3-dehydroquinate synthase